jgi:protein tyrosine phosphatase (PTP) superfamily phosphohydrolase (DUF442 family)
MKFCSFSKMFLRTMQPMHFAGLSFCMTPLMKMSLAFGVTTCAAVGLVSCSIQPTTVASQSPSSPVPNSNVQSAAQTSTLAAPTKSAHAFKAVAAAPKIFSGPQPETDEDFAYLASKGVKVIVSVDGAKPDLEAAKRHGIRYIHIPTLYRSIETKQQTDLARVFANVSDPIFVHCHHGKHRGPAAVGAALVRLNRVSKDQAKQFMVAQGTARSYVGLWQCVADAPVGNAQQFKGSIDDLPEVASVSGLVEAMVGIDAAYDHLRLIQKNGWKTPPNHPDLVPPAEAGRLADLLRDSAKLQESAKFGTEMVTELSRDAQFASDLENFLATNTGNDAQRNDLLTKLGDSGVSCHTKYRNK